MKIQIKTSKEQGVKTIEYSKTFFDFQELVEFGVEQAFFVDESGWYILAKDIVAFKPAE